jgi:hypothetical protein
MKYLGSDHPGVVWGDVVRHEVEQEPDAAPGKCVACLREAAAPTEMRIYGVAAHAVRRADVVLGAKVG